MVLKCTSQNFRRRSWSTVDKDDEVLRVEVLYLTIASAEYLVFTSLSGLFSYHHFALWHKEAADINGTLHKATWITPNVDDKLLRATVGEFLYRFFHFWFWDSVEAIESDDKSIVNFFCLYRRNVDIVSDNGNCAEVRVAFAVDLESHSSSLFTPNQAHRFIHTHSFGTLLINFNKDVSCHQSGSFGRSAW